MDVAAPMSDSRLGWERRRVARLAVTLTVALAIAGALGARSAAAMPGFGASPPVRVSDCPGQNAEVEEAVDHSYVYDEWIGCSAIGFARSVDGGRHFDPPLTVPGSFSTTSPGSSSWDPAVAVGPNGTVYAAFMFYNAQTKATYPVVAASFDHGQSFTQVSSLPVPPSTDPQGNWGDRDFIAVSRTGTVYVTWDYGPSASEMKFICSPTGSCGFAAGDLNVVIQKSDDGGQSWTSLRPISPGFPISGADSAPLVIQPDGTIDVLYQDYPTDPQTFRFKPGVEYFTRSLDHGKTWSAPIQITHGSGTESLSEWWIDGDISTDSAGNLYATWDTQSGGRDVGWLAYSTNGGTSWTTATPVTPGRGDSEELVEVAGAGPGVAYIGWQTPSAPQGYATYIRPFSIRAGWLTSTLQVSTAYGDPNIWPGDTFGIATIPADGSTSIGPRAVLSWGSAIDGRHDSEIFSSVASLR